MVSGNVGKVSGSVKMVVWKRKILVGVSGGMKSLGLETQIVWVRFWHAKNVGCRNAVVRVEFLKLINICVQKLSIFLGFPEVVKYLNRKQRKCQIDKFNSLNLLYTFLWFLLIIKIPKESTYKKAGEHMFLNAGGFDKVKAAERAIHGLNFSEQDRPGRYEHVHEMSKAAFEKSKAGQKTSFDWKAFAVKTVEVAVIVVAAGVLIQFLGGLF